ncbi:MAG: Gfo/Idh/MocA family oxidoreductase [Candidatus Hydrogenedentes bacterium]|nr:Gfo/Idh/MocA family oxidoreductase [Candidatus Hydrogenedentota bacterium]
MKANIIGTGIMGSAVAQVIARDPRIEFTAVCDKIISRVEPLEQGFGIDGYKDYIEMLDEEKPDIVFIATPDWAHLDPVMACLERGIHVFVEKPLTTNVAEAKIITEKVAETGLKLQVSYNHRWLAPYHLTYKKIQSGAIGRPLMGYARKNNPITVPTQMLASWAKDSSPLWFQSSHDIDLMLWWFDDEPVEVLCSGVKSVLKAKYGWDTWDALQGQVRFKQGGVATFEAAWIYPEGHPSMPDSFMSVVGEHGHLQVDRKDEAVEMSSEDGFSWPRSLLNSQVYDRWIGAFPSSIASFIDAIEDDREPYVTARDGWRVTAVLDALHRAADSGGVVKLPSLAL